MKQVFHFVDTNILSGLENMVINIATLVDGYEHVYVSPSGPINSFLRKMNVKHITVKKLSFISVRDILHKYKPDIVQGHDVKASCYLAANFNYCRKKNIKMVSELHNNDKRMLKPGLRACVYLLASFAFSNIVVVSQSVLTEFFFGKLIKAKTKVIKNVINPVRIQQTWDVPIDDKKWDVIFLGRLTEQKQPLKFVEIISQMTQKHEVSAVMVGQGELEENVKGRIRKDNLESLIKLTGFQANPYQFLSASKVLLIPSSFEGFGLVALEALMLGVPVIAAPVGGLVDIASEDCGGFATTVDEFSKKALQVINDPNYFDKTRIARERGLKLNNVNEFVDSFKSIYK